MNINELQTRLVTYENAIIDRGWRKVKIYWDIESVNVYLHVSAQHPFDDEWAGRESECFLMDDFNDEEPVRKWIRDLALPEDIVQRDFQKKLAAIIDYGHKHGIEADFLNPIVEAARKLAENAIEGPA